MKIKRLDIFLLKTFLPLFIMTFGICLFIVLMQFLWKYIDEMVGKGLEIGVLTEMFFYAALSFVPMALPLAILLASLMTFGNLGEQLELLAMKSAGISLLRIMKPLIFFLCFIAVGAFYFQNNIIPLSQVKMFTLLYSMKQKSPELEIPENTFCNDIMGYNLYVKKKDKTGLLKELMIYDYSEGFNNAQVTVADSGRIKMSSDKLFLILTLYNGESFENLKTQRKAGPNEAVPYRKESFSSKEILIKFDANFNRADESIMQDRYIGKNLTHLRESIDSMTTQIDSIREINAQLIYNQSYKRNLREHEANETKAETSALSFNFDSIYLAKTANTQLSLLNQVKSSIESIKSDYSFKSIILSSDEKEMRRHHTEMHKKFTLSFACLIFFFIGAPLGAIIRKGGLGMPTVISVALFIFYYIIDNVGFKMASNGMWQPWQGMWLSSAILLPLGIFLTYKAANDSVILNADTYINGFKKFIGIRSTRKIDKKEVIIFTVDYSSLSFHIKELKDDCIRYLENNKRWMSYFTFWHQGGKDTEAEALSIKLEKIIEEGCNSDKNLILNKLMDFPYINGYQFINLPINEKGKKIISWLLPIGILLYLPSMYRRKFLLQDVGTCIRICVELDELINK